MKRVLFGSLLTLFTLNQSVIAQDDFVRQDARKDVEALLKLSEQLKQRERADSIKIAGLSERFGASMVMQVAENGKITQLVGFDELGNPEFYETHNSNAAATTNTDDVHPGGGAGFSLTGSGIEIGEWDGGAVRATHQELTGRVTQVDGATSNNDHATHVAGTMIASGVQAAAKGMAYQATLKAHDFNNDESEMATYAATPNAIVSNHSYGTITGWYFNPSNSSWYWYGTPSISQTEDYNFGFYNYWSYIWDTIANAAPNYLIVKSAGNDRNDNISAAANDTHFVWSSGWTLSTQVRAADCPTGYDCISTTGNAKNILTVGAVNDITTGYTQPSQVVMSSFSGWGPSDDGRIKPDIVGNGVSLYSSGSASNNDYYNSSGTSMSAPNVTGSLALIQQYYEQENNEFMRSSALKGLVIHTANEAGNDDGPDYRFGWGLLDTRAAVEHIEDTNSIITWADLNNGDSLLFNYYFDGSAPLVATICWNDPAGTPVTAQLDPTTLMLVNDLDLRVINDSSGMIYQPWVLNPNIPANAATTGDNFRDNVEKVEIANPDPGFYTIRITHKGSLAASQEVSLILSRKADPPFGCVTTTSSINANICQGQTFTTPGGQILSASGTYTDILVNAAGCDSVITILLNVSSPQVNITSSSAGCSNVAPDLFASATGGTAPYTWLWNTGSTSSSLIAVANGTYTVTVTDAGGCTQTNSTNVNATLDNTPPVVITQNITVSLDGSGNATVLASQVNNGSFDNCGIASMNLDISAFDCNDLGANTVNLTVVDSAGNSASAVAVITIEDNLAPVVTAQNLTVYLDATGSATITTSQVNNGTSDNCSISTFALSQSVFTCNDLGSNVVSFTATDNAGNNASVNVSITVLDTISPVITGQNASVYLNANGSASLSAASLVASGTDNCSVSNYSLSQSTFDCSDLGVMNVVVTATDASGNTTSISQQVTIIDTIAPVFNTVNTTVNLNTSGTAVLSPASLLLGAQDNCGIDSIMISQTVFDCNDAAAGSVPVVVSMMDASGNTSQTTVQVQVNDVTPPSLTLSPTIIYLNLNGTAGVSPSMIVDQASDNCGISQLYVTPASFGCDDIGFTTVTVFAQDAQGNTTNQSVQIEIVDMEKPNVLAQDATLYLDVNGQASLNVASIDNGTTDNCGLASLTLSNEQFTCAHQGVNNAYLVATDVNGNVDSALLQVTIIDTFNKVTGFVWSNGIMAGVDDSVRVNAVNGATYQWDAFNGSILWQSGNQAVVNYTNGPNARVWVVQTSVNGCSDTTTRKVKVWPLDVQEIADGQMHFQVFPNPASSELNVKLFNGQSQKVFLDMYNALGQKVLTYSLGNMNASDQQTLSLPYGIARGMYMLQIQHDAGIERMQLLVE
jgi:hypothetical protein